MYRSRYASQNIHYNMFNGEESDKFGRGVSDIHGN